MKILIIRHGQSANNALFLTTGGYQGRSSDPQLTELGHRQAHHLADFVAQTRPQWAPTVITSSLFSRAIQTATPLAEALDLPIEGQLDTYEIGGPYHGQSHEGRVFAGTPASQLQQLTERLVLPEGADETGWFRLSQRETTAQAYQRAEAVMARLTQQWGGTNEVVAVVCHQFFAQQLIRVALGLGSVDTTQQRATQTPDTDATRGEGHDGIGERPAPMPWFRLDNTATALIDYGNELASVPATGTNLFWLNRVDHLPAELVTN